MYKKFKKHFGYYTTLILILSFGLILTLLTSPNVKMQAMIVFLTVFFYILWGLLHHLINHELTPRIVIEYVLIGALGMSILFFTLMGGVL
jgi:hypothetical protein